MNRLKRFSIIIPTYNNAEKIGRSISSIKNQTFKNWELIVIDDGSTDNTQEVIDDLQLKVNFFFFKQPNGGVAKARNMGASKAKGEFIIFLDSDDELIPDALWNYDELINKYKNVGFFSSGFVSPNRKKLPRLDNNVSPFKYLNIPGSFGMRHDVFEEIGGYDTTLYHSENWEMTARALEYCEVNSLEVIHQDKYNLIYNFESFPSKNWIRNRNRAHASLYLYKKYKKGGPLFFHKNKFLIEAAINSIRINRIKRGRIFLLMALKEKRSLKTFFRYIITLFPFLRKKVWQNTN